MTVDIPEDPDPPFWKKPGFNPNRNSLPDRDELAKDAEWVGRHFRGSERDFRVRSARGDFSASRQQLRDGRISEGDEARAKRAAWNRQHATPEPEIKPIPDHLHGKPVFTVEDD